MTPEEGVTTWAWTEFAVEAGEGGVYVLPPGAESPLWVEGTAHDIWGLLGEGASLDEILAELAGRYGESIDALRAPVLAFVQHLEALRVISRASRDTMGHDTMGSDVMVRNVLTVCTGNVCRSVFAERLLARQLARRGAQVAVASAGTAAGHGHGVPGPVTDALEGLECDGREHVPTPLTAAAISRSDLVLTATIEHRNKVLALQPVAMKRTFTVLEAAAAARYLMAAAPEGPRTVAALARARSAIPSGTALDVADPFGGPRAGYEKMTEIMVPAVEAIADFLSPGVQPPDFVATPGEDA